MKELKDLIRNRVIDFNDSYSKEMKELHTKAIIAASAGDSQAKIYLKEMIRLRLIQYDRKFHLLKYSLYYISAQYNLKILTGM